jgi:hypothetical protein
MNHIAIADGRNPATIFEQAFATTLHLQGPVLSQSLPVIHSQIGNQQIMV